MPLSRERTGAMGRALARLRQSRSARPARHGRLAKTLLVALLLVAPVAVWAGGQKDEGDQDNLLHALKRVTMCVDRDSVAVHLDGLTPSRRGGAQKTLLPGVTHAMGALTNRLVHGATLHRGSCVGNAAYLAVDIRITALDPNVYRRYGRHPFSYAIWVQVGQYASRSSGTPMTPRWRDCTSRASTRTLSTRTARTRRWKAPCWDSRSNCCRTSWLPTRWTIRDVAGGKGGRAPSGRPTPHVFAGPARPGRKVDR